MSNNSYSSWGCQSAVFYKGEHKPWKIIERHHPISDGVKKKYLHPFALGVDKAGKIYYKVEAIQNMHEDIVLRYCKDKNDMREYNDLCEVIRSMYVYRDGIHTGKRKKVS
jgi:hypothetical protein